MMMMMMIMRMTHWNGAKAATISWISVKQSWNFIRHVFIILQDWAVTPTFSDAAPSLVNHWKKYSSLVLNPSASCCVSALYWIWIIILYKSSVSHYFKQSFPNKFLFFKCHWLFRLHQDMHFWYLKLYIVVFHYEKLSGPDKNLENIFSPPWT